MSAATIATRTVARHAFPAMGSTIELALAGEEDRDPASAWQLAEELAAEWERTFSRFRPDSELSRLNTAAGQPVAVSPRFYDAVAAALEGSRASGGLFDPTILPALVALGYDRDFRELDVTTMPLRGTNAVPRHPERSEGSAPPSFGRCQHGEDGSFTATKNRVGRRWTRSASHPPEDADVPAPGVSGIVLDPTARTVWLPAGVTIDLGGIAKGLYADALAAMLADWPGGCVSAGGDLRVWGDGPTGDGWVVGVEHPGDPERDISRVRMHDEAAATSGTNRRSWRRGDAEAHHLIDPRTGTSADRSLWSVTVVGQTAGLAEVAATALFLSGGDPAALDGFAGRVGPALIVEHDGVVRTIDRREH